MSVCPHVVGQADAAAAPPSVRPIIRPARRDEYESIGELAVHAYGTLEDAGDPDYDRQFIHR
jgi:hypothetical protein